MPVNTIANSEVRRNVKAIVNDGMISGMVVTYSWIKLARLYKLNALHYPFRTKEGTNPQINPENAFFYGTIHRLKSNFPNRRRANEELEKIDLESYEEDLTVSEYGLSPKREVFYKVPVKEFQKILQPSQISLIPTVSGIVSSKLASDLEATRKFNYHTKLEGHLRIMPDEFRIRIVKALESNGKFLYTP